MTNLKFIKILPLFFLVKIDSYSENINSHFYSNNSINNSEIEVIEESFDILIADNSLSINVDIYFSQNNFKNSNKKAQPLPINHSNKYNSVNEIKTSVNTTKRLSLANQNLSIIPYDVFSMDNLEFIDLSNNKLSKLPEEIKTLINLREIKLGSNKFDKFPSELLSLPKLEIIDLSNNLIFLLKEDFSKNYSLNKINLSKNNISGYINCFETAQNLMELDISNNKINGFSFNFISKKISSINLSNNRQIGRASCRERV